jgi:hypothetical protein
MVIDEHAELRVLVEPLARWVPKTWDPLGLEHTPHHNVMPAKTGTQATYKQGYACCKRNAPQARCYATGTPSLRCVLGPRLRGDDARGERQRNREVLSF